MTLHLLEILISLLANTENREKFFNCLLNKEATNLESSLILFLHYYSLMHMALSTE